MDKVPLKNYRLFFQILTFLFLIFVFDGNLRSEEKGHQRIEFSQKIKDAIATHYYGVYVFDVLNIWWEVSYKDWESLFNKSDVYNSQYINPLYKNKDDFEDSVQKSKKMFIRFNGNLAIPNAFKVSLKDYNFLQNKISFYASQKGKVDSLILSNIELIKNDEELFWLIYKFEPFHLMEIDGVPLKTYLQIHGFKFIKKNKALTAQIIIDGEDRRVLKKYAAFKNYVASVAHTDLLFNQVSMNADLVADLREMNQLRLVLEYAMPGVAVDLYARGWIEKDEALANGSLLEPHIFAIENRLHLFKMIKTSKMPPKIGFYLTEKATNMIVPQGTMAYIPTLDIPIYMVTGILDLISIPLVQVPLLVYCNVSNSIKDSNDKTPYITDADYPKVFETKKEKYYKEIPQESAL